MSKTPIPMDQAVLALTSRRLAAIVREVGMPPRGGVIHCFTGDAAAAREFLALGFHISFSGILTFKSAATLREAAPIVPAERLLAETDAPYLAPEPYRGKRNEPAFVARTFEVLAHLRDCDRDVMAAHLDEWMKYWDANIRNRGTRQ